jgi:hypothetical protein
MSEIVYPESQYVLFFQKEVIFVKIAWAGVHSGWYPPVKKRNLIGLGSNERQRSAHDRAQHIVLE